MKSTSSLWVGALWQAAMPLKHEIQSSNTSQTAAEPSSQALQQTSQPTNPA
ncbi:hypothetical protein H5202_13355 [Shewanella sp. SG41-4]|uniref:hypothetical protein n=1 Tax=Shewanella sp. SG41-4 TaxID=2760976 RepID=UPI0015FF2521|nr:hypothetical protein [Shewanella sp. SG41-4]MBB1439642.1 hypothetical protein [Shewanella sp. SG41-4]